MRKPFLERITGITNAGTAVYVSLPQIRAGTVLLVEDVSAFNESGETVTMILGVIVMGTFIGLGLGTSLVNGNPTNFIYTRLWVREGETLAIQTTGTADKGKVTMSVSGWLYDTSDPPSAIEQE